ncbi:MAG: phosphonate ABC transporter, permease protein PhnE [Bdellovibrionales bacterium]|nr:phosphonate ABC transporter, permease protein PhnE [Bdellovibrionales bacterium]
MSELVALRALPPRFSTPSWKAVLGIAFLIALAIWAFAGAGISTEDFIDGLPEMWRLIGEMFPPDIARSESIAWSLVETFQMALAGTIIGVLLSFPLSALAARNTSPHWSLYQVARGLTALFRTIPDLVWALFFVATVGIGPFAGTLTIAVDTMGFCARFFAEGMEEADRGPEEALKALGSSKISIFFAYIFPVSLPSITNSSLFSLEKAVRSSVILGLVGAGGIGIELKVAMEMFRYDQACTIILCILILVIGVERVSSFARSRLLDQSSR